MSSCVLRCSSLFLVFCTCYFVVGWGHIRITARRYFVQNTRRAPIYLNNYRVQCYLTFPYRLQCYLTFPSALFLTCKKQWRSPPHWLPETERPHSEFLTGFEFEPLGNFSNGKSCDGRAGIILLLKILFVRLCPPRILTAFRNSLRVRRRVGF